MRTLDGVVRPYAWGSRTAIASLRGMPTPSPHPEAELWFGAHPAAPANCCRRWCGGGPPHGHRLRPRRSARCPLCGPLRPPVAVPAQGARRGGTAVAAGAPHQGAGTRGVRPGERRRDPGGRPDRNYRDDNHKPELVVALSEFDALAGFRDPAVTVELLRDLQVPELDSYLGLLAGQPDSHGLRALFTTWLTLPDSILRTVIPAVLEAGDRLPELGGATVRPRTADGARTRRGLPDGPGCAHGVCCSTGYDCRPVRVCSSGQATCTRTCGARRSRSGQLRQRPAWWPDAQAHGRPRAARGPGLLAVGDHGPVAHGAHGRTGADLLHSRTGVPAVADRTRRHRDAPPVVGCRSTRRARRSSRSSAERSRSAVTAATTCPSPQDAPCGSPIPTRRGRPRAASSSAVFFRAIVPGS